MMKFYKFGADWCCNCRRVDACGAVNMNIDEPAVAEEAKKYGVNNLPTFIVDDGRRPFEKLEAPSTTKEVADWLEQLRQKEFIV